METPNSVLLAARKNDFLALIDLKDAYFQIPVHPSSRKLLCFVSNGTVYQFKALCFRLATAPQVFTSFHGSFVLGSLPRRLPATITGRLADPVLLGGQDKATRQPIPHTLQLPHHSDKQGEVRPLPVQVRQIPRHDHRHGISPSVPHRGVVGTHGIVGEAGALRKTLDALPPVASEVQLVHRERSPTPSGTPAQAGGQGHLVVDDEKPSPRGDALWGTPTRTPPILRRVSVGVGSPPPRSFSVGTMVRPGDLAPHQHTRDESSVPGTSDLPKHNHQPASDSNVRQLHGGSLRQQAGGDSIRLPLRVDRATSPLDVSPQRTPGSEIPSGTVEHPRGSPQPPQPSTVRLSGARYTGYPDSTAHFLND